MGNKKSSPVQDPEQVIKRRDKHAGRRGKPRPTSEPIPEADLSSNFILRHPMPENARSEFDISRLSTEPVLYRPTQNATIKRSDDESNVYNKAMKQVVQVWPEYGPIEDISLKNLRPESIETLQQIYKRIFEQHVFIETLAKDKHEVLQAFQELQEERDALSQTLVVRDMDINALKDDIVILNGELKRRGIDVKLSNKHHRQSDSSGMNGELTRLSGSEGPDNSERTLADRLQKRASSGLLKPTPMLLAEGRQGIGAALKRSESLKNSSEPRSADSGISGSDRFVDELNDKLRRLQASLENERQKNEDLRGQLESYDSRITSPIRRQSFSPERLARRYQDLEAQALGQVMSVCGKRLGHVPESKLRMFLCEIVVTASSASEAIVEHFMGSIQRMLTDPLKPDLRDYSDNTGSFGSPVTRSGSVFKQRKIFEKPHEYTGSRLAQRTAASKDIPRALMKQVACYLEETSDSVNLSALIEEVMDSLGREFSDCVTPALVNHPVFVQFLHDVCRLLWQMSVLDPPMYLGSDTTRRFDERYHTTLGTERVINAEIDYFYWPILFTRKHGAVMHPGRVCLKL